MKLFALGPRGASLCLPFHYLYSFRPRSAFDPVNKSVAVFRGFFPPRRCSRRSRSPGRPPRLQLRSPRWAQSAEAHRQPPARSPPRSRESHCRIPLPNPTALPALSRRVILHLLSSELPAQLLLSTRLRRALAGRGRPSWRKEQRNHRGRRQLLGCGCRNQVKRERWSRGVDAGA